MPSTPWKYTLFLKAVCLILFTAGFEWALAARLLLCPSTRVKGNAEYSESYFETKFHYFSSLWISLLYKLQLADRLRSAALVLYTAFSTLAMLNLITLFANWCIYLVEFPLRFNSKFYTLRKISFNNLLYAYMCKRSIIWGAWANLLYA